NRVLVHMLFVQSAIVLSRSAAGRQLGDPASCGLLGTAKLVCALQVQPELRAVAEPMAEPQRRVAGDRPTAIQALGDAVGRHGNLASKLGRCDAELFELVLEDFSGMDGRTAHGVS